MAKRKNYSQEYKLKAVELVVEQGQSPAAVARSLGLSSGNLRRWVRQHQEQEALAFPGKGSQALTPEQQKKASSAKSMGSFWFRQLAKRMI